MSRHPDEDQLLDLVLELLPRDREEEILEHITHCSACEQRMLNQAAEKERLASTADSAELPDPRAAIPTRSTGESGPRDRSSTPIERMGGWLGTHRPLRILLPAGGVAVLALLTFLLILRERPTEPELQANWLPTGTALVQRGGAWANAASGTLADGLDAYNRHDLPEAIRNLKAASVPAELEPFRRLYLASALTLSSRDEDAVRVLRHVSIDYLPEPWASEGYWTLLVALQGAGMRASADSLRQELSARPGEVGARVRKLR